MKCERKVTQNVSYITCVPLAVCDMSFDFPAVTTVCLFFFFFSMYTFSFSVAQLLSFGRKPFETKMEKYVGANQGFLCGHAEISMNIVFVRFCKKKRKKKILFS